MLAMKMVPKKFIFLSLGLIAASVVLYTFNDPTLCKTGCGSLTEPLFHLMYWAFGAWGPRLLLSVAAVLFFWAAATTNE